MIDQKQSFVALFDLDFEAMNQDVSHDTSSYLFQNSTMGEKIIKQKQMGLINWQTWIPLDAHSPCSECWGNKTAIYM